MKKRAFGVAVAAYLGVLSASAADLPSRKEPPPVYYPPPPVFTWTGLYAGLNVGGGWLDRYDNGNWLFPSSASNTGGVIGGAQIGYNYRWMPLIVVGVETDFQGSGVGSSGLGATRSVDWFGTVRGRAGVSMLNGQLLVYGTGGFAYGDLRLNQGWLGSQARTGTGWTAGGGLEYAFLPKSRRRLSISTQTSARITARSTQAPSSSKPSSARTSILFAPASTIASTGCLRLPDRRWRPTDRQR